MIDLLHARRAAYAAIRGYLYQAAVGVERWLELHDNEILLCEGDEDLDRLLLEHGAGVSEQLKNYSGRLGWGSPVVAEGVRNFVRAFVARRQCGEKRTFVFTTTAELRPGSRGFDVLGAWHDPAALDQVIAAIRSRLSSSVAELAWLDAERTRWADFVKAVDWRFGAPNLDVVQQSIEDRLAELWPDKGPAQLLAPRLLAESLRSHAQATVGLRVLTRDLLLHVLGESEDRLRTWAASAEKGNLDILRATIRDELRAHELEREQQALAALLLSGSESLPVHVTPASLLRAGTQVVSFVGRGEELAALDDWLESGAPVAVWAFTGSGGTGKTRLLVEWVNRVQARGVPAGFLKKEVPSLEPLFGALGPRVIVVDYAENRLAEVRSIVRRLAEDDREQHRPFRLVLLARGLGEWWEGLAKEDYRSGILLSNCGRAAELDPLVPQAADRQALYELAIKEFGAVLRPTSAPAPAVTLDEEHFAQGLYVLMAALMAVGGESIANSADLLDATLEHERRYWRGAAGDLELGGALEKAFLRSLERAVVLLTMWGGRSKGGRVRDLVRRIARSPADQPRLIEELFELLLRFYGRTNGARGLEPDLLGEHLVQRALEADAELLLSVAVEDADEIEATSLLTVLNRLAHRRSEATNWLRSTLRLNLPKLAKPAIDVALATGDPIGTVLAEVLEEMRLVAVAESVRKLLDEHHEQTTVLRETAVAATRIVLEERSIAPAPNLFEFVKIVRMANNLGVRLSALGRGEAALAIATKVTEAYRRLVEKHADVLLPELAASLTNLGSRLIAIGRREAALEATEESTELYRRLADERPARYLPYLAKNLTNLGAILNALGRLDIALKTAREATDLLRRLASGSPDVFLPDLAASLNNLGAILNALGRPEEALGFNQESTDIRRKLADERPDAFLPDLATSLSNVGKRLLDLGRPESALDLLEEATEIRRNLAKQRPGAFSAQLANSLNNLGSCLHALGRLDSALEVAGEATNIFRQLVKQGRDVLLPHLAGSLNNLAIDLGERGMHEAAVNTMQEAIDIRQALAAQHPDAFLGDLFKSLSSMGALYEKWGDPEGARRYFGLAIDSLTPLFVRRPAAVAADLVFGLKRYLGACQRSGEKPDSELVARCVEAVRTVVPNVENMLRKGDDEPVTA